MIYQITDRVYCLPGEELTDRPFLYYIHGDGMSVAVDAGASANHVARFYHALKAKGLPIPAYTIITHWHWDHTFGIHAVSGQTIASSLTNAKLREMMQWEWSEKAVSERLETGQELPYGVKCFTQEYAYLQDIIIAPADIEVEREMYLDLGGLTCQIIQKDATHSRDGLFIYVPEEKVLVVGDADYEDYYDNDYKYDKQKLSHLIEFVKGFDYQYYLRGHEGFLTREASLSFLSQQMLHDERSEIAP